jgi:hypothetical protein
MSTDKKHIAVYLDPAVEAALVEFCEQKGLKSKKGTMFSAGVNAVLAEAFNIQIDVKPRNARLHTQIGELQADMKNLYQALDKVGSKLAHLADAVNVAD